MIFPTDQYNVFIKSGLGNSGRLSSTRASLTVFIKAAEEGVIYTCVALHSAQAKPKLMLSVRVSVLSKLTTLFANLYDNLKMLSN